ncbi:hypothetical protein L6452_37526 [Arctium lappa]|uniref:Uncharacterized protein n=1 Tax=Arctium lappa TaxID=4217 RepID=A0ACB8Y3W7_ARCLA|nr:hypothetical protein L6452_37526 [Arctium lappa]
MNHPASGVALGRSTSFDSFESVWKNRTRRIIGDNGCRDEKATDVVAMDGGFTVAKESNNPMKICDHQLPEFNRREMSDTVSMSSL